MSGARHPSVADAGWPPVDILPVCLVCEDAERLLRSLGEGLRPSQGMTHYVRKVRHSGFVSRWGCHRA